MQADLGPLDDETRAIRAHIGSLVGCDSGIPVTIDELLNAIGTGKLPSPAFHNGCWLCRNGRTTQPHQAESMRVIEDIIGAYLGDAHTPVKRWLAACLWHQCVLAPPASLYRWGRRHKELLARTASAGVSVRTWMDSCRNHDKLRRETE